ncbi:MAG: DUF421 domain-containing protein [Firmicutes bacterium]|nr:DUF421 domain-containing protein [Bacillota bacterium]
MGKAELSKVSTFQMVVLFIIAELAAIPIDSPSASILNGITAIFTLLLLEVLFSFLSVKSSKLKQIINGSPTVLIDEGKINVKEMRRLRISLDDLLEQLRIKDCPSVSDVAYAVMEPNGELSVIKTTPPEVLPIVIINDGILLDYNMEQAGISKEELFHLLNGRGILDIKEVFLAFYDTQRQFHVFPLPPKDKVFSKEAIQCAH